MRQNQLIQCAWIGGECCLHSTCLWERNHHWSDDDDVAGDDDYGDYGVDGGRVRERQQQPLDSCDEHGHGEDESMIVAVVELQSLHSSESSNSSHVAAVPGVRELDSRVVECSRVQAEEWERWWW